MNNQNNNKQKILKNFRLKRLKIGKFNKADIIALIMILILIITVLISLFKEGAGIKETIPSQYAPPAEEIP